MTDIVRHKGYTARACYDASAQRIYGRVDGIGAEIAFRNSAECGGDAGFRRSGGALSGALSRRGDGAGA